jgi:hypothetical protein
MAVESNKQEADVELSVVALPAASPRSGCPGKGSTGCSSCVLSGKPANTRGASKQHEVGGSDASLLRESVTE